MSERTSAEFAHFFASDLVKELKQLEVLRKGVLRNVGVLFAVTAAILAGLVWFDLAFGLAGRLALILGFLCLGGAGFLYRYLISGYVHEFKIKVIKRIVGFIDPGLEYWPNGHVEKWRLVASRIFERNPDRVLGDDLVRGKIGATKIELSEVHAQRKHESYDRYGRRHKRWHTVFKGLFFAADFNKHFSGKVLVLPDTAEKLLGGAGKLLQSLNRSRGDLVRLEDPEFERHFVVYGDDQIESRYVLSTSLMRRILEFRKKTGRSVFLSFVGSEVFVALPYGRPLFEPRVFTRITDFRSAETYFDDLRLALGIVEDLDLNTRIWSKQEVRVDPAHGERRPPLLFLEHEEL